MRIIFTNYIINFIRIVMKIKNMACLKHVNIICIFIEFYLVKNPLSWIFFRLRFSKFLWLKPKSTLLLLRIFEFHSNENPLSWIFFRLMFFTSFRHRLRRAYISPNFHLFEFHSNENPQKKSYRSSLYIT